MRRREHLSGLFDFLKRKREGAAPPPPVTAIPVDVNLYQVLGVTPSASPEEIRAAYRDLARQYHPDRNPGDAEAYQKFLDISKAHDVLADERLRAAYDQAIGLGPKPSRAEEKRRPVGRAISTYRLTPEQIERERKRKRVRPARPPAPWDILFETPAREEAPLYQVFEPSRPRGEAPPPPWDVLFPERVKVTFPSREELLAGVQRLPLDTVWDFIRENRTTLRFLESRTIVVGPVAGMGSDPVEHDLAVLTGASFDEIATFAERKGLHRAWRNILGPLAEQAVLAIESLKPADIPGAFYMDWDPSGRMLELLYTEGSAA